MKKYIIIFLLIVAQSYMYGQSTTIQIENVDDLTINCHQSIPETGTYTKIGSNPCFNEVTLTYQDESTQAGYPYTCYYYNYTITRTWTATDACDSTYTQVQTITVQDIEAPTWDSLCVENIPLDYYYECKDELTMDDISVIINDTWDALKACYSDNCTPHERIIWTGVHPYDYYRWGCSISTMSATFRTLDYCNNYGPDILLNFHVNTIQSNLELVGLPEQEIYLNSIDELPEPPTVMPQNPCQDSVIVNYTENLSTYDECEGGIVTRTWSAVDECNRGDSFTQTIHIAPIPSEPVVILQPASDLTLDLNGGIDEVTAYNNWLNSQGGATLSDQCADVTWDYGSAELQWVEGQLGEATVTFTLNDANGNIIAQTTATFTVMDSSLNTCACPIIFNESVSNVWVLCGDEIPIVPMVTASFAADAPPQCNAEILVSFSEEQTSNECNPCAARQIIRTWTASIVGCESPDNNFETQQTIFVLPDTEAPEFIENSLPQDGSGTVADFNNWLLTNGGAQAQDNGCCGNLTWSNTYKGTPNDCLNEDFPVVFTVTDKCGNSNSHPATFTIIGDVTPPVVDCIVLDYQANCSDVNLIDFDTWLNGLEQGLQECVTDNCTEILVSTEVEELNIVCPITIGKQATFTFTDNNGNISETTLTVNYTITDNSGPEFSNVLEDLTVSCDNIPNPAPPIVFDLCTEGEIIPVVNDEVIPRDGSGCYIIHRTWTATDLCGNESIATQTITVIDNIAPVFNSIPQQTIIVECDAIPFPIQIGATDNCDDNVQISFNEVEQYKDIPNGCYHIIRTWTATDNCNNSSQVTQTLVVEDTAAPIISAPTNISIEACFINNSTVNESNAGFAFSEIREELNQAQIYTFLNLEGASIVESCGYTLSYIDNVTGSCPWTIEREFEVIDDCGNVSSSIQLINVQNSTTPQIQAPNDLVLEGCSTGVVIESGFGFSTAEEMLDAAQLVTFLSLSGASIDEDCSYSVKYQDVLNGSCPWVVTRTFTVTDVCGNENSSTQIITINDTTSPIVIAPSNIEMEGCSPEEESISETAIFEYSTTSVELDLDQIRTFEEMEGVSITESCQYSISYQDVLSGNCPWIVIRTFTITDACGNTGSSDQIIRIHDTTVPTILGVPEDITVECNAIPAPTDVTGVDNCNTGVLISFEEEILEGSCADNYTITRTWTATDNCGNSDSLSQVITVEDTTAPILVGVPEDTIVECSAIPASADVTATDNCDADVMIELEEIIIDGSCANSYTITRTWIATDNCGNSDSLSQVITVEDTIAPILVGVPEDTIVECSAIPASADVTATDNCDADVMIELEEIIIDGSCADNYAIIRTWIATDNCGNSDSLSQVITVEDTTAPILVDVPENTTVECDAIPTPADVTATDNCDADVMIGMDEIITVGSCANSYTITRTWTATDNCGNSDSLSQVITVRDTTAPILVDVPENIMVQCGEVPSASSVTAMDNCNMDIEVAFTESSSGEICAGTFIIRRTWTATDSCGNTSSSYQDINVIDTTTPEFSNVPADVVAECDDIPIVINPNVSDNCDNDVEIFFNETLSTNNLCPHTYIITRQWEAVDDCGNSNIAEQVITVMDTAPPVITLTSPIHLSCEEEIDLPELNDNCSATENISIDFDDNIILGSCPNSYTLIREWIATDECGNISNAIQEINISDDMAPEFIEIPLGTTVECDEVPTPANVEAIDNCGGVTLELQENTEAGNCGNQYTITRTWVATDDCGNSSSTTQVIEVIDTTAPEVTSPSTYTAYCSPEGNLMEFVDWLNNFGTNYTSDNCGETNVFFEIDDACTGGITNTGFGLATFDPSTSTDVFSGAYNIIFDEDENTGTAYVQFDIFSEFDVNDEFFVNGYQGEIWRVKLYLYDAIYNNNSSLNSYLVDSEQSTIKGIGTINQGIEHNIIVVSDNGRVFLEHDEEFGEGVLITFAWQSEADNSVFGSICIYFEVDNEENCCGAEMDKAVTFTVVDDCGNITEESVLFIVEDPNCDCTPDVCQTNGAEVYCVSETPQGLIMQMEWESVNFSSEYLVTYQKVGSLEVFTETPNSNSLQLVNLEVGENYTYSIQPYCDNELGGAWTGYFFTSCEDFAGSGNSNSNNGNGIKTPYNPNNSPVLQSLVIPYNTFSVLNTKGPRVLGKVNTKDGDEGSIDIFPNPTRSELNISLELKNEKGIRIEVYDMLGRKVATKELSPSILSTTLNVNHLENGSYILLINNGKKSYTKKFVKI